MGAIKGETSDGLKPCPFCGGEPVLRHPLVSGGYGIECDTCRANIYYSAECLGKEVVIEAWNRRAKDD